VFRLEKSFDIKIPRGELFPEDILNNAEYLSDGKVTPAGIEQLKKRMPFADLAKFEANPVVQDFVLVLTVQDLVRYVESKLNQGKVPAS
jgi:acyl carrier protein